MTDQPECTDTIFQKWLHPKMEEALKKREPYVLCIEPTNKCFGSCLYCYSTSNPDNYLHIKTNRLFQLMDEALELGMGYIMWIGGDPIEHPDFFKLTDYAVERGFEQNILLSGLITKEVAKKLKRLHDKQENLGIGIHIDSIIPEVYNRVHADPTTLEKKIQGYRNLLDTGFPAEQTYGLIHLSKPIIETVEKTVDWFMDEMKAPMVFYIAFKPSGFGADHKGWEYSKSDLKRVNEYRAKKCGAQWLKIGPTEVGRHTCDTEVFVYFNGDVGPCSTVRHGEFIAGNIYQESFVDIVRKHKDMLLFNFEAKGLCGNCDYNDYCRGCRGAAYWATGDITAADPKCYRNPANVKEYVYGGKED